MTDNAPSTPPTDEALEERYQRLIELYSGLLSELNDLHKNGLVVKQDIHVAIDQVKMQQILAMLKKK